jgi:hypothetical protein
MFIPQPSPKIPQDQEWIKKMCYLYTMEFYSARSKNNILLFADKWMELETISIREVSQARRPKIACSV